LPRTSGRRTSDPRELFVSSVVKKDNLALPLRSRQVRSPKPEVRGPLSEVRGKIEGMQRLVFLMVACLSFSLPLAGQSTQGEKDPPQNQAPPRSERSKEAGESSSRDTRIDLSPPRNDAKDHPNSSVPGADADDDSGVQEFHTYDPHRAAKDIEVGDFYFKRKNYGAALDRYREALFYKPNDAMANFRMAQAFEKLAEFEEATAHYQDYLRILPHGPLSAEAQKALEKLNATKEATQPKN
jgi:tetratricopeptide (TPR) repeat protein